MQQLLMTNQEIMMKNHELLYGAAVGTSSAGAPSTAAAPKKPIAKSKGGGGARRRPRTSASASASASSRFTNAAKFNQLMADARASTAWRLEEKRSALAALSVSSDAETAETAWEDGLADDEEWLQHEAAAAAAPPEAALSEATPSEHAQPAVADSAGDAAALLDQLDGDSEEEEELMWD